MNATRKMEPVMSASDPIPTPDEEVKMLTALGFIDLGYHPTVTCFELVDSIETPLCAIMRNPGQNVRHSDAKTFTVPARKRSLIRQQNVHHSAGKTFAIPV